MHHHDDKAPHGATAGEQGGHLHRHDKREPAHRNISADAARAGRTQRPSPPTSVTGEGKIIVVLSATEQIVVEHGEIKGFMDAMTMGYKVNPPSLLGGLKAGDQIGFTIDTQNMAIVKIEKLKQ
jgi:Cu(I)/Ag(I) efflux system protein CusF